MAVKFVTNVPTYIVLVSPASGVLNCFLAAGPGPAFVLALIVKMYSVTGLKLSLDISIEVSSAEICCVEL